MVSLECFALIKGFEVQNFELILSHKLKLACFTLVVRDNKRRVKYIVKLIMFQIVSWTKTQNLMHIFPNLKGTDCY